MNKLTFNETKLGISFAYMSRKIACMIEVWMTNHSVCDNNCNIVGL